MSGIATDCLYVYATYKLLQQVGESGLKWLDNRDLWCHLFSRWDPSVPIIKVKGHATEESVMFSPELQHHKLGNDCADRLAVRNVPVGVEDMLDAHVNHVAKAVRVQVSIIKTLKRRREMNPHLDPFLIDHDLRLEKHFCVFPTISQYCNCRPGKRLYGKQANLWCTGMCKHNYSIGDLEHTYIDQVLKGQAIERRLVDKISNAHPMLFKSLNFVFPRLHLTDLKVVDPDAAQFRRSKNSDDNYTLAMSRCLVEFVSQCRWVNPSKTKASISFIELFVCFVLVKGWPEGWIKPQMNAAVISRRFSKRVLHILRDEHRVKVEKPLRHLQHCAIGATSGLNTRPIIPDAVQPLAVMALSQMLDSLSNEKGATAFQQWIPFRNPLFLSFIKNRA